MTKISQINTTNNIVPSTKPKAQKAETAKVQPSCGNGVYPSGELLRTMAGVQTKETPKPQAAPKQGLFSKDTEDIKKYLYSLKEIKIVKQQIKYKKLVQSYFLKRNDYDKLKNAFDKYL